MQGGGGVCMSVCTTDGGRGLNIIDAYHESFSYPFLSSKTSLINEPIPNFYSIYVII